MNFCYSHEIYPKNRKKCYILLQNMTRCCKNRFYEEVHKTTEEREEMIGNKIPQNIVKPMSEVKSRNSCFSLKKVKKY